MDLKNKKWDETYIIFNILNNIMLKRSWVQHFGELTEPAPVIGHSFGFTA